MKLKAILFDVLVPIFTYILGIVSAIFGLIYLIGSVKDEPKRKERVTYHGYSQRES